MAAWDGANSQARDTEAAAFIPELWSNEVIAAYKANLVLANLVVNFNHNGRKGDTINIPVPGRNAANTKSNNAAVTLIQDTATTVQVVISTHQEWSMLIEDTAAVQALDSMRQFYTDDAGYALADAMDDSLFALYSGFQGGVEVIGGDGSTAWSPTGAGNGTALTDAGIRAMMQTLDDVNVPERDRFLVIPPVTKNTLLGLSRFTEQAFVGEGGANNSIRTGYVGNVYGTPVYVSTNCPTITNTSGTTSYRVGLYGHKSCMAIAIGMGVRTQSQYKQEYLADLFTADVLYGVKELRDDGAVAFVVPA